MKTPEEIEKMAIEWSNDYIGEVSKRISKTAFIEAYNRCQQDNVVELLKWAETKVFYSDPNDGALISYDVLIDKIKSLNKKD
ncbi:MAG: hypothetical protein IPJ01_11215 [Micavibrio sp.]|nr:hypothetical protein [Micavibrio sp.]